MKFAERSLVAADGSELEEYVGTALELGDKVGISDGRIESVGKKVGEPEGAALKVGLRLRLGRELVLGRLEGLALLVGALLGVIVGVKLGVLLGVPEGAELILGD